jgi:hemerythrin-like domain-containing protein
MLAEMYQRHIDVEESEVFPFAARLLTLQDREEIAREMSARRNLNPSQR